MVVEIDVEDGKVIVFKCVVMNFVFCLEFINDKLELEFFRYDLVEMMNLGNGLYG